MPAIIRDLTSLLTMSMNHPQMSLPLSQDISLEKHFCFVSQFESWILRKSEGLGEGFAPSGNGKRLDIIV